MPFSRSANVFVFGNFNIYHKDSLIYSGATDTPGELSYTVSSWLTSLLRSQTVAVTVLLF